MRSMFKLALCCAVFIACESVCFSISDTEYNALSQFYSAANTTMPDRAVLDEQAHVTELKFYEKGMKYLPDVLVRLLYTL